VLAAVGIGASMVMRAVRRSRRPGGRRWRATAATTSDAAVAAGRAYLYKLQLALGRSARGIQDRLAEFAAQGDTTSEAGLAALLQQSALELLRNKDSIRYAAPRRAADDPDQRRDGDERRVAGGALALPGRARARRRRPRGALGRAGRGGQGGAGAGGGHAGGGHAHAARAVPPVGTRDELAALLSELGGVPPTGLLGLEVIWTPADANDSMTETDVMTTYPELRSL
jgi:uncharacterized membrane protein